MVDQKEIVDQGSVGFIETMPRYRINAKQLASGLWQMDLTVELRTPVVQWPQPDGDTKPMTAPEIWELLAKDVRKRIRTQFAGKFADEKPAAPPPGAARPPKKP